MLGLTSIRAVVVDLDGTLLNSDKRVSARNLNALLHAHEVGIRVICATARPPRTVKMFLPPELLAIATCVYYNGAHVVERLGGNEWMIPLGSDLTNAVVDFCMTHYPDSHVTMEVDDEWLSIKEIDGTALVHVSTRPKLIQPEQIRQLDGSKVLKILLTEGVDVEELRLRFGEQLTILVTDAGQLVQLMSKHASKEAAVARLCTEAGIDLRHVIAFGDDYNDLGLLQLCGYSVAMGNAVEELKRLAHIVTETNDSDGVAIVLEQRIEGVSSAVV
jgi:Cof subfamily protein (haloacid dehalogenase superfamily)